MRWTMFASCLVIGTWACGGGDAPPGSPHGEECRADAECASGICLPPPIDDDVARMCTIPCTQDTDCAGIVGERGENQFRCGVAGDGRQLCVPPCDEPGPWDDNYVCENDVSIACLQADSRHCGICGCPEETPRCDLNVGCFAQSTVGGPCAVDGDCVSGNCSQFAGVCRVPIGASCSTSDCDSCYVNGTWSTCSRHCEAQEDCNSHMCLESGTCWPRCNTRNDCPESCDLVRDTTTYICHPSGGDFFGPSRDVGHLCVTDAQCASGACAEHHSGCDPADTLYDCNFNDGMCTTTCDSDAQCANGTRCAAVPCSVGQVDTCGSICVRPCVDLSLLPSFTSSSDECPHAGMCETLPLVGGGEFRGCRIEQFD